MMDSKVLFSWFARHGGSCDTSALGLREFEGYGQGAVALRSLPEGHVLFSIPRELTLSTRTSALPTLLGQAEWQKSDLHRGWAGLILCMMWEEAQGSASKWSDYLASLPASFDTPMFWSEEDLLELKGTSVVDKLGKDAAEKDYREKVVPVLEGRPDIFGHQPPSRYYSLENYHLMGSRILSRSFNVEKWDGEDDSDAGDEDSKEQRSTDMDVDEDPSAPKSDHELPDEAQENSLIGDDGSEDEGEDADSSDVAMVPMADMLNARYGSENAKLFYEKHELRMVTTKAIAEGEQIWNTYGDPPNSHLLRCYGHVDLLPLPGGTQGNQADIVELRADLVVQSVSRLYAADADRSPTERVDWWLEEGGEDLFIIDTSYDVPDELISFARLLLMEVPEWDEVRSKRKLPKAKVDERVLLVAADVLQKRTAEYPTTLEEDETLLSEREVSKLSLNKKHSVIVRLGEKRILQNAMGKVQAKLGAARSGRSHKKRTADENGESSRKKQKSRR